MSKRLREMVEPKQTKSKALITGNTTRAWLVKILASGKLTDNDEMTHTFIRRRAVGNILHDFDRLRVSGRNGKFKPPALNLRSDKCEICGPLNEATSGVICTSCQEIVDGNPDAVIKVPAHLLV
jgi:hypothetical protein